MSGLKPATGEIALALGRADAEKKTPYFMAGAYGLVPYPVPGLGTMGVTKGLALIYDPDWTKELPTDECGNTIIHEVIHVYLDHCKRIELGNMDPEFGNIAADLSDNGLMEEMGLKLPHGYYPKDFGLPNGQTIEYYYEQITKNPNNNKKIRQLQKDLQEGSGGDASEDSGDGNEPSDSSAEPRASGGVSEAGKPDASGAGRGTQQKGKRGTGRGRCGGVAGNPIDKELEDRIDKEIKKDVPQSPEARAENIQKAIEAAIEQHASKNGRGSVPSSLLEKVARTEEVSKVRWQDELRQIAMQVTGRLESGGMDFSMAIPSKRSYARGILRPGMVQMQPEFAFIMDTSGSMGTKQITDSVREIVSIMRKTGVDEAWLIEADAGVAVKPKRIRLNSFMNNLEIHGRGGTNFDPALQELMKLRPRPDVVFYLTDGDGYVTYKPPIPVVWVIVKSYYNRKPAEWGHSVFVDGASDGFISED